MQDTNASRSDLINLLDVVRNDLDAVFWTVVEFSHCCRASLFDIYRIPRIARLGRVIPGLHFNLGEVRRPHNIHHIGGWLSYNMDT